MFFCRFGSIPAALLAMAVFMLPAEASTYSVLWSFQHARYGKPDGRLLLRALVAEKATLQQRGDTAREGRDVIADDARELGEILRKRSRPIETAEPRIAPSPG